MQLVGDRLLEPVFLRRFNNLKQVAFFTVFLIPVLLLELFIFLSGFLIYLLH